MSILIKGIQMPKNCVDCPLFESLYHFHGCHAKPESFNERDMWNFAVGDRPSWCPLVEVQTPHGRLIDAGAFIAEQRHLYCENCERRKGMKNGKVKFVYDIGDAPCRACGYGDVLDDLEDAPTVIEEEEGDT